MPTEETGHERERARAAEIRSAYGIIAEEQALVQKFADAWREADLELGNRIRMPGGLLGIRPPMIDWDFDEDACVRERVAQKAPEIREFTHWPSFSSFTFSEYREFLQDLARHVTTPTEVTREKAEAFRAWLRNPEHWPHEDVARSDASNRRLREASLRAAGQMISIFARQETAPSA